MHWTTTNTIFRQNVGLLHGESLKTTLMAVPAMGGYRRKYQH